MSTYEDRVANSVQSLVSDFEGFKDRIDGRLDKLETRLNRPNLAGLGSERNSERYKAFTTFIRQGETALEPHERRALVTSDDTKGGYVAPPEFVAEVLKNIVLFSPVRQAARVGKTSSGEVLLPRRTSTLTATWVGETESRPATEPSYGMVSIPVDEAGCYVDISNKMLEDAAIDMAAELAMDFAEEFGRLEGAAFINGSGLKKPSGFMQDADVGYTPSGAASSITADSLIDLYHAIKPAYRANGIFGMNAQTLSVIRKLKTGDGAYIVAMAGINGAPASTLLGRPIVEMVDMVDISAGSYPLIFGDFSQGYRIYDRLSLAVLRDPYSIATVGQTRFHARRRVGGGVAKSEALRKLKIGVS